MSTTDIKSANPDEYPRPTEDQQVLTLEVDWSPEEEAKAKRK